METNLRNKLVSEANFKVLTIYTHYDKLYRILQNIT